MTDSLFSAMIHPMKKELYKLPAEFIKRIETQYPKWSQGILTSFANESPTTFRINRIKTTRDAFRQYMKKNLIHAENVAWYDEAFILKKMTQRELQETEAYKSGWIYLQNLSSMVPPLILDPKPGENILDLCAAPGSKTTQIASMTDNGARIVAVEKIKPRFYRLRANCELMDAKVELILGDGSYCTNEYYEHFDKVLVDAPCSSEGQFSISNPRSYAYWSSRKVNEMKHKQKRLIAAGWRALKPGGVMVYSTCTYSLQENEDVLFYLARKFGDEVELLDVKLPFRNTIPGFTAIEDRTLMPELKCTRHILPTLEMEGFFVSKLIKRK